MKNSLGNLIEALQQIREQLGDEVPVSINLWHDRKLALQDIYVDTTDNIPEVLFEADLEDNSEVRPTFTVEGIINEPMLHNARGKEVDCFLYDLDKMYDLLTLTKKEFLKSYIYMSESDYDCTLSAIKPVNDLLPDNDEQLDNLAEMCRRAENLYIEEINDRPTEWNVLGSQLKEAIYDFVRANYTEAQQELFNEYCNDLAI